jgi:hypothetical protein
MNFAGHARSDFQTPVAPETAVVTSVCRPSQPVLRTEDALHKKHHILIESGKYGQNGHFLIQPTFFSIGRDGA